MVVVQSLLRRAHTSRARMSGVSWNCTCGASFSTLDAYLAHAANCG